MSRPTKQGVDYFPVDCQFDDKIELLIAEKGGISVSVLVTVWQLTYQNEGYYIAFSDDLFLLIKRRLMIEVSEIESIILAAISRNIFCEKAYLNHKILTSKAVQKRYFIAAKKKKNVNVIREYLCKGVSASDNCTYIGIDSAGNSTKVKVKEEVKEEEEVEGDVEGEYTPPASSKTTSAVPYQKIINLYHDVLPNNPQVASLSPSRKAQIRARWKSQLTELDSWQEYFNLVSQSKFLTGQSHPSHGRKPFLANIDFLIKENNVLKVVEGNYHD